MCLYVWIIQRVPNQVMAYKKIHHRSRFFSTKKQNREIEGKRCYRKYCGSFFLVGNAGGAELVMVLRVVVVVVLLVALEGAIYDVDSTKAGKKG